MNISTVLSYLGPWFWNTTRSDGLMISHIWKTPIPYGLHVTSHSTCPLPPPIRYPVCYPFDNKTARMLLVRAVVQLVWDNLAYALWLVRYVSTLDQTYRVVVDGGNIWLFWIKTSWFTLLCTVLQLVLGRFDCLESVMIMEKAFLKGILITMIITDIAFTFRQPPPQPQPREGERVGDGN
ncbi:hypothetical protein ACRALDRAFT_2030051 [Sodiomyces alcalophilus JCM 7366]|uniref:uncharacterized protein n=1 Tax=Sodiomyces alcalophilus JCM 7366 TaxID=591952 RepID=UPI0039B3EFED